MKIRIQITIEQDDKSAETITEELTVLTRSNTADDTLGLTLAEGKDILATLQQQMVKQQIAAHLQLHQHCNHCHQRYRRNGRNRLIYRTLFGNVRLDSQRYYHCDCTKHETKSFSPLTALIPERTAPELAYLRSKWSSLVSYGMTVDLMEAVLPLNTSVNSTRRRTMETAQRLEDELEAEQTSYIEGAASDWAELPLPEERLFVGIDGGFVRNCASDSRATNHFEVIVGKSLLRDHENKRFAFVQTYDAKPKRRLFEALKSQGMQMNQDITFLTDGADDVRQLPYDISPLSEHITDWFHIAMKVTVMQQIARGITVEAQAKEAVKKLEGIKHRLWHGHVTNALKAIDELLADCEFNAQLDPKFGKLARFVKEFGRYIKNNTVFIPNYAERHRYGEIISTSFAESAVNEIVSKRMVKKQQMRWSKKGAHLLLQVRVKTLNDELRDKFEAWYPSLAASKSATAIVGLNC